MRILILLFIVQIFTSCQNEINESGNKRISNDKPEIDTLSYWIYDSLFLGKFQERKLVFNSDSSKVKIRISQVNPIGGHSRIISFAEGINYGFSYSLKVECLNNSNYFGIGDEDSEWLKLSFHEVLNLAKSVIKKGSKNYKMSNPTKWVLEILEDGKYEYSIFDSLHMFDIPEELKSIITLIETHTKFGSSEFKELICSGLNKK